MLRQKFITLRIFVEENKKKKILNENNNCKLNINHRKLDLNYFLIVVLVDVRHEIIKKESFLQNFTKKRTCRLYRINQFVIRHKSSRPKSQQILN